MNCMDSLHQSVDAAYSTWRLKANYFGNGTVFSPYYGKIATAAFLGNEANTQIHHIRLDKSNFVATKGTPTEGTRKNFSTDYISAYAAYTNGTFKRLDLINLYHPAALSAASVSLCSHPPHQPCATQTFTIQLPRCSTHAPHAALRGLIRVKRLVNPTGTDANVGTIFDNKLFEYESAMGKPSVANANVVPEINKANASGWVSIGVRDSEAVNLSWDYGRSR